MWRLAVIILLLVGSARGGDGSEGGFADPSSGSVDCAAVFPGIDEACCRAVIQRQLTPADGSSTFSTDGLRVGVVPPLRRGALHHLRQHGGRRVLHARVARRREGYPGRRARAVPSSRVSQGGRGEADGSGLEWRHIRGAIANGTQEAVAKAEAMLRPFGTSFCARAGADSAAAAHCREYRAVIAVMDAAAAMANELASDDGGGGGVSVGPFTLGEDATVRLRVASSTEDRVGFFTNAKSGWAAFFAVVLVALVAVAIVGTALDAFEAAGGEARDGTVSEPLLGDGEESDRTVSEPLLGDGEDHREESEELVDAGDGGDRDGQSSRVPNQVADGLKMFSIRRNWPKLVAAPAEPSPTDCLNG